MSGYSCDTSVLVAAHIPSHPHHAAAVDAVSSQVEAAPVHSFLETYSVLTRMPPPFRFDAKSVAEALDGLQLRVEVLPARAQRALVGELAAVGIRGGAVYDGLVALTAKHHGRVLLSLDQRAAGVYEAVGVPFAAPSS